MRRQESGFSAVLIILLIVLMGVAGFAAWRINNLNRSEDKSAINSFAECKAAGYPIMESYPERCAANDQTFTNPDQKVDDTALEADETDGWLLYASAKGTYKIRIPDGWDLVTIPAGENLYDKFGDIAYAAGTKANVKETEGGWDGAGGFSLYVPAQNQDQIVKEGTKQGDIQTNNGLKAEKYYYFQDEEPEGIGYSKGSKVYSYYFGVDGKYIQLQHVIYPGGIDETARVEQMLKTLQVN